jgi:hypothetical protein
MMKTTKMTRTTEIIVEKSATLYVRNTRSYFGWCARCAAEVRMITPDEAAQIKNVSTRKIYNRIETGQIHFEEINERLLLVCLNSL